MQICREIETENIGRGGYNDARFLFYTAIPDGNNFPCAAYILRISHREGAAVIIYAIYFQEAANLGPFLVKNRKVRQSFAKKVANSAKICRNCSFCQAVAKIYRKFCKAIEE